MTLERVRLLPFLLIVGMALSGAPGISPHVVDAAERATVAVIVSDALSRPNKTVRVESRVIEQGLFGIRGVGGERVSLWVEGTQVASSLTGGDGRAYFEYEPRRIGLYPLKASVSDSPRVKDAEANGSLAVWEKRRPLLLIEQAVLYDRSSSYDRPGGPPSLSIPGAGPPGLPAAGAAEELNRLSKFYYNLLYLVPADGPSQLEEFRAWLKRHRFPPGLVLAVPLTVAGMEEFITRTKGEGWENLRAGVGRTPVFAQALVSQRMTVAVMPVEGTAEFPRKARIVKDWKSVRKHLQS